MPREERIASLRELEAQRGSRVISYVLSDRESFPPGVPGLTGMLAVEPQLIFVDILREIGHTPRLDLLLYTRGGATESVWPLVSVLRQYCDHFAVLVPFRAHSAGTMICLGADEVVMTDFAELSPIDPTTGNQFNPRDPVPPNNQYGISVEDVVAYFELAKERVGLKSEAASIEVFRSLTQSVHPLALGNVQRVYLLIRRLARRLLALHLDETKNAEHISHIIDGLTTEFFSHLHAIPRIEANALMGDWVVAPSAEEESALMKAFDLYVADLDLGNKFMLPRSMGSESSMAFTFVGAILETTSRVYECVTEIEASQRVATPGLPPGFPQQQPIALTPGTPRAYDFAIQSSGWLDRS